MSFGTTSQNRNIMVTHWLSSNETIQYIVVNKGGHADSFWGI